MLLLPRRRRRRRRLVDEGLENSEGSFPYVVRSTYVAPAALLFILRRVVNVTNSSTGFLDDNKARGQARMILSSTRYPTRTCVCVCVWVLRGDSFQSSAVGQWLSELRQRVSREDWFRGISFITCLEVRSLTPLRQPLPSGAFRTPNLSITFVKSSLLIDKSSSSGFSLFFGNQYRVDTWNFDLNVWSIVVEIINARGSRYFTIFESSYRPVYD